MTTLAAAPEHTWRRNSTSQESIDTHSSETDGPYAPPPIALHPSPYHGITAAAFTDINRALAIRSLRDSVRASSGGLQPAKGAAHTSSYRRAPKDVGASPARRKDVVIEPPTPCDASRPKSTSRQRSLSTPLKALAPLRSGRPAAKTKGTHRAHLEVALPPEGGKSHTSVTSLGIAPSEGERGATLPHDSRLAEKRGSTVRCIIM